jgi:TPR repeat protein
MVSYLLINNGVNMKKSNKSGLTAIIIVIVLFGISGTYFLLCTKPLLTPAELNRENIRDLILDTDRSTRKQIIAGIAASIEKVQKKKQRGLWLVLASFCHEGQAVNYYQDEITCWPKGTSNDIIASCYREIGNNFFILNMDKKADYYYRQSLRISPHNIETMSDYATFLNSQSKDNEACLYAHKILKHPKLERSMVGGAIAILQRNGHIEEGILEAVNNIQQFKPVKQRYFWFSLAEACELNDYSVSLSDIFLKRAEALSIKLNDNKHMMLFILYNIGQSAEFTGKYKKARQYYQKILEIDPGYMLGGLKEDLNVLSNSNILAKLKRKVKLGDDTSMVELGLAYLYGSLSEKNPAKAVSLFKKAVEMDNSHAMYLLGLCYDNGLGVKTDKNEAIKLYKKGAAFNHSICQGIVGDLYYLGEAVNKDYAKAADYYLLSAKQGYHEAQRTLGECYLKGEGVPLDRKKAVMWLRMAALQNNKKAILLLKKLDSKKWLSN